MDIARVRSTVSLPAAVTFYLHVAAINPVLVSGFWLLLSERFDPRTAKRRIGRIAGAGTLGGLAGGLAAERLAAWTRVADVLPALAALHLACAAIIPWVGAGAPEARGSEDTARGPSGPTLVRRADQLPIEKPASTSALE